MATLSTYVSTGLYSTSEAARLIQVDSRSIRRWSFGYRRRGKDYPSAISTELPKQEGHYALTFLELIELLSVRDMLDTGLTWPKVRDAFRTVRKLMKVEHPFATRRWFADPDGLFVELARDEEPDVLVDLVGHGQIAMLETLEDYLVELEFGPDDYVEKWHPWGPDEPIVIDPKVAFGQPVIRGTGTRTDVVYRMHQGGEDVETIAWAYDLEPSDVRTAIEYEDSLAA